MNLFSNSLNNSKFLVAHIFFWVLSCCWLFLSPYGNIFKYFLFSLALLAILYSFLRKKTFPPRDEVFELLRPWLPWFLSLILISIVHGAGGLSLYLNGALILILSFLALKPLNISRNLILSIVGFNLLIISVVVILRVTIFGRLSSEIFDINKNILVCGLTLMQSISLASLIFDKDNLPQKLYVLLASAFFCSIAVTVLTEVRTAILPLLATIPIIFLFKKNNRLFFLLLSVGLLTAVIVLFLITGRLQEGIEDLTKYQIGNHNTSWGIRLELWKLSLIAFMEQPLLGWGAKPFDLIISSGLKFSVPTFPAQHFHSDYFNALVSFGLVGIVGWLSSVILLFKAVKSDYPRIMLLVSMLVMGASERMWFDNRSCFYLFISLWLLLYISKKSNKADKNVTT